MTRGIRPTKMDPIKAEYNVSLLGNAKSTMSPLFVILEFPTPIPKIYI